MQYHEEDEFGIYKEDPARHRYSKLLMILILLVLVSVIGAFVFSRHSKAEPLQKILTGKGLVCDTQEQIEKFISLEGNLTSRLTQINATAGKTACVILLARYLRSRNVKTIKDGDGNYYLITQILVFAFFDDKSVISFSPPILQYTVFAVEEA